MNPQNFDLELDILQAQLENLKVYTEIALKEAYGPNALAYELEN